MPTCSPIAAGRLDATCRRRVAHPRGRSATRASTTPVIVSGGIHDFEQAEAILERGDADVVRGRAPVARRSRLVPQGQDGPRRRCAPCTFTNYCEGLDQKHKQVTCKLWDRLDLDGPDVKRGADGKRRLVAPAYAFDLERAVED